MTNTILEGDIDFPKLMFADQVGPWRWWFSWRPVITWDGEWVWGRKLMRARYQVKAHLPQGLDQFWVYAKACK